MTRPLFLAGNKRSGTSQLVRLMNRHPQLFVSHESDIAWILFQFHHHRPLAAHPWDSDRGMRTAMEAAGGQLRTAASPRENFVAFQLELMRKGTPWLPPQAKQHLAWIGDKKPLQHTDPELVGFILQHFPDARFVHIVRHPFEVVDSSDRFNRTADGDFWLGLTAAEKLERWTFHEELVLALRERLPDRVHTVRYEDLCRQTARTLAGVFAFLEVEADPAILRQSSRRTFPLARTPRRLPCQPRTMAVAERYGYDVTRAPSRVRALADACYWRLAKTVGI